MAEKKSFVMYKNWMSIFCTLPDDKAGELIKAIYQYQNGEEINITDVSLQAIFTLFKEKFDADNRQYELKCEINRENGSKGGKQKVANGKQIVANGKQTVANATQSVANGSERLRTDSVRGRNVADTDTDNDNDNNKRENIIKEKNVIPPKLEWVKEYCRERGNDVDAETFFDFYESKNWLIGKVKMKDWQAAVRTWEKNKGAKKESRRLVQRTNYDFEALRRMIE